MLKIINCNGSAKLSLVLYSISIPLTSSEIKMHETIYISLVVFLFNYIILKNYEIKPLNHYKGDGESTSLFLPHPPQYL